MLTYVTAALKCFNHTHPLKPQDQPYPHVKLIYGAKAQYINNTYTFPLFTPENKTFIQEVMGTFLYYVWTVNATTRTALGPVTPQQVNLTEHTMKKLKQFLDYAFTHPNTVIT